jgi:sugar/nucleoside kinase (ribokinase family)
MYGLDRNKPYDVVAIGNAILDVLSFTDDAFLQRFNLKKGAMTLIDADEAKRLYEHMGDSREVSGGSAANTLAGMASLGARTAFIGKICDDQLGAIYRHDLRAVGVDFDTPASIAGKPTGCSYILVTPDAERTMNTYLGAGSDVDPADVDETLVGRAKIFYGEGYQWSTDQTKSALRKAFASMSSWN